MKHVEFYRNDKDGSVLVSVGTQVPEKLIYAGQELTHLVADTVDAAKEKHIPVVKRVGDTLEVTVGSVIHPMLEEHHIEWIALATDDKLEVKFLKPGEEPKAEFETGDAGEVYAYCNLHGLWKESFAVKEAPSLDGATCSPEFGGCVIHEL